MKRLFILLLIACSTIATIHAQQRAKGQQTTPIHVKTLFNDIIKTWGSPSDEVFSINKNPNTNLIESSVRITYFVANNSEWTDENGKSLNLKDISEAFKKDEPTSYQLLHLSPGTNESFSLRAVDGNGKDKSYLVRGMNKEEMWLLCTKNAENPQLRDAYAIKWTLSDDKRKILGGIYQITSLRPDVYMKNMSSAGLMSENQNTFTIDGRVGYDLTDSLYVVYMADTAEELDKVGDNDYVATMPVVNKRFSFSVQLDKPKVGRIRTVMPDGSLCELWTNLDFVPGETYRITTHNGYYDEDRDYEQRVGRYSGKSLLNDLQRRGIDDQTFTVVDEVPEEFRTAENNVNQGGISTLSVSQNAVLFAKAELVKLHIDKVKNSYQMMGAAMKDNFRSRERVQLIFKQILQQNKELDKQYQEIIKYIRYTGAFSSREWSDMYKEILKFYTEQNQGLSEAYKDSITNGRPILKLRDYLNKQTEKYMKEMSKVMTEH